jgi:hypothetical protein
MKLEGSLPCSQKETTGLSQPNERISHPHILCFKVLVNIAPVFLTSPISATELLQLCPP